MDDKKLTFVEDNIIVFRGKQVLLDTDVAEVYGVETKHVNQAVRNNPLKFPEGYVIKLEKGEWAELKSKFLTSKKGGKQKSPTVFSEKGLFSVSKKTHKSLNIRKQIPINNVEFFLWNICVRIKKAVNLRQ
jgi:hypothetical protein